MLTNWTHFRPCKNRVLLIIVRSTTKNSSVMHILVIQLDELIVMQIFYSS